MNKRQLARLNNLLPKGVPRYIRVYDNEGESADRYSVIFTGRYDKGKGRDKEFDYLAMSASPYHPQGIGIHGSTQYQPADTITHEPGKGGWKWPPALGRKCHLGRRIRFEDLPGDCQEIVLRDYREIWRLTDEKEVRKDVATGD